MVQVTAEKSEAAITGAEMADIDLGQGRSDENEVDQERG